MTLLRVSDWQSKRGLDSIRNSCDIFILSLRSCCLLWRGDLGKHLHGHCTAGSRWGQSYTDDRCRQNIMDSSTHPICPRNHGKRTKKKCIDAWHAVPTKWVAQQCTSGVRYISATSVNAIWCAMETSLQKNVFFCEFDSPFHLREIQAQQIAKWQVCVHLLQACQVKWGLVKQ